MSKLAFRGLIDNLESATRKLRWKPGGTEWGEYYDDTNYSANTQKHKEQIIREFVEKTSAKVVWDLGANTASPTTRLKSR